MLLSTLHNKAEIKTDEKMKPKIETDYNDLKGAVDTVDKMVVAYSCKRMTKRWPLLIFYNMIDISCYNAFVLYCETYPDWKQNKDSWYFT